MIDRSTGLKTSSRKSREGVWLAELKADIDRGCNHFWSNRPRIHAGHLNGFGSWVATPGKKYTPREIALAYLAIPRPKRGTLRNMVNGCGLQYKTVWAAVSTVKKERKALAAGEVSQ